MEIMKLFSFDNEMRDTTPKYPWRHRKSSVSQSDASVKPRGGATLTDWRGRKGAQPATGDSVQMNPVTKGFFLAIFISFLAVSFILFSL